MVTSSIVLYKTSEKELRTILKSALDSFLDMIYVVDNSPTNERSKIVGEFSNPRIEYLYGHGNVGYGTGNNIAIKKAIDLGADYHIVLNPDLEFKKGVLEELYDFMEKHKDVGMVMPMVYDIHGDMDPVCRMYPTPLYTLGRKFFPAKLAQKMDYHRHLYATGYNKVRNVPMLDGGFMFMRISVIKEVGMFDERYFMYWEDFDFIRRIHKASKTVFYPKVSINHYHKKSAHFKNKKMFLASLKTTIQYYNKWGWLFDKERSDVNRHAFDDDNIIDD